MSDENRPDIIPEWVTVVIPTMGRSELLRALASVRAQTFRKVRTIVVLDNPALEDFVRETVEDELLIVTPGRIGAAAARNLGLDEAKTEYVAFLDDDDWWDAEKLQVQMSQLSARGEDLSFTGTFFHEVGGTIRVLPERAPAEGQSVASYLVLRPGLKHGAGYIQTSSIVARTTSLRRVRWDSGLPKHQDWDLVVRLVQDGSRFVFTRRPLVHVQQGTIGSISKTSNWRASSVWLDRHRHVLSRKARGDFVATQVLRSAAATRDLRGLWVASIALLRNRPHFAALAVGLHGFLEGRR